MAGNIGIQRSDMDEKSWFNIKKFRISGVSLEGPVKTLDSNTMTPSALSKTTPDHNFQIIETSKFLRFSQLRRLIDKTDDQKTRLFFGCKKQFNLPTVVNLTLDSNPLEHLGRIDMMGEFFDTYHECSQLAASVPNIRLEPGEHTEETIHGYLKFVDESFVMLSAKNHKPVFVPISLRMSPSEMKLVCEHYLRRGYSNLWVDFDGSALDIPQLVRLRRLYVLLVEKGQFENTVFYHTNMRREINPNPWNDQNPASDVLAPIAGANIVGVNRECPKTTPDNSHRILDRNTYYYVKTGDPKYHKKRTNTTHNAIQLSAEFRSQTEHFHTERTIVDAIKGKSMLKQKHAFFHYLIDKSTHSLPDCWF